MIYAIEKIDMSRRTGYTIRTYTGIMSAPTDGKRYTSEQAARDAAERAGINIQACGDRYEILAALDRKEA